MALEEKLPDAKRVKHLGYVSDDDDFGNYMEEYEFSKDTEAWFKKTSNMMICLNVKNRKMIREYELFSPEDMFNEIANNGVGEIFHLINEIADQLSSSDGLVLCKCQETLEPESRVQHEAYYKHKKCGTMVCKWILRKHAKACKGE